MKSAIPDAVAIADGGLRRRTFMKGSAIAGGALLLTAGPAKAMVLSQRKRISCGDAFLDPEVLMHGGARAHSPHASNASSAPIRALLDVGEGRIATMDARGVGIQIMAHAAWGLAGLDRWTAASLAIAVNDRAAEACRRRPARLAVLATLATLDGPSAAYELERCVRKLGMRGGVVAPTPDNGSDLEERCRAVIEAASALKVPLYLQSEIGQSGMSCLVGKSAKLASDTACSPWRQFEGLLRSEAFGRLEHPCFVLDRVDTRLKHILLQAPSAQFSGRNCGVHFATSGSNYDPHLDLLVRALGADRFLYASDAPFTFDAAQVELAMSSKVASTDLIFRRNAERLFGIA